MKMKIKNKKAYVYALLFLMVMIIDQRLHTASIVASRTFVQVLPLLFLTIILFQMKKEKLKNLSYIIYIIIAGILTAITSTFLFFNEEFYLKYSILLLEVFVYGFICLYIITNRKEFFHEKLFSNWKAIFWALVLFLMCISKYNGLWPWGGLAIFILLIIFDIKKDEQQLIFRGMIYGIILSYFMIQGCALLFRPYDIIRYNGAYNNTNMNGLFYVVVFAAFLSNHFRLKEKKSKNSYIKINYFFLISVFTFTILTIGKAALLTEIGLLMLYFLIMSLKKNRNKFKFFATQIVLFVFVTIMLLPVCFTIARYIPTIFNKPVWFYGEYSKERVHSYDAYNSEKYPKTGEVADLLLERYLGVENLFFEKTKNESEIKKELSTAVAGDGADSLHPLYIEGEANNTYSARIGIWKEYFNRLNVIGHKIEEPHFWLTESYYILHAHNIFLEFAYNFGAVTGILFFFGYVFCAVKQLLLTCKIKDYKNFTILILIVAFGSFGIFELDWYIGQAPLTLFFFMLVNMIWNNEKTKKSIEEGEKKREKKYS